MVHGVLACTPRAKLLLAESWRTIRSAWPRSRCGAGATSAITTPTPPSPADPNLAELHQAGRHPGVTRTRFALAVVNPAPPAPLLDVVPLCLGSGPEGSDRWSCPPSGGTTHSTYAVTN
ncbi:hypothetical protein [Streptomyces violascens]|uniref:hypothetical protein n=1 Tax=Streptomyces violascens TaxID=67381 RepID=UPI003677E12E